MADLLHQHWCKESPTFMSEEPHPTARIPAHPIAHPVSVCIAHGCHCIRLTFAVLTNSAAFWTTASHWRRGDCCAASRQIRSGRDRLPLGCPPGSSGMRRATYHMIVDLGAVALFFLAWVTRGDVGTRPGPMPLGLRVVALCLLSAGAARGRWSSGTRIGVITGTREPGSGRKGRSREAGRINDGREGERT